MQLSTMFVFSLARSRSDIPSAVDCFRDGAPSALYGFFALFFLFDDDIENDDDPDDDDEDDDDEDDDDDDVNDDDVPARDNEEADRSRPVFPSSLKSLTLLYPRYPR